MRTDQQEVIRDLFSLYSESVFRYAVHILNDSSDAEDVLQQVFIRVAKNWSKYRGDASAKTWIMSIAKNYIFDVLRKKSRVRTVPWSRAAENMSVNQVFEDQIDLKCYVSNLPFQQRSVIVLYYFDDLPVSEVAAILEVTESKVRRMLRQALSQLHDLYVSSNSTQSRGF